MNTVSTKLCCLYVGEGIVIGHNFNHQHQHKKTLKTNLWGSALVR
jgi:hypothetical protein